MVEVVSLKSSERLYKGYNAKSFGTACRFTCGKPISHLGIFLSSIPFYVGANIALFHLSTAGV